MKVKYPIDRENGEELDFDEFQKYLWVVARNAIRGGRKRKPVEIGNDLVKDTIDSNAEHERDWDNDAAAKGVCEDEIDEKLMEMKQQKLAVADMALAIGLSSDQGDRRLQRMYKQLCAIVGLQPTPMGRSKPRDTSTATTPT